VRGSNSRAAVRLVLPVQVALGMAVCAPFGCVAVAVTAAVLLRRPLAKQVGDIGFVVDHENAYGHAISQDAAVS